MLDHLEALRSVIWKCVFTVVLALIPALYFSGDLLRGLIRLSAPPELRLHYFSPFEPLFVQLNLSLAAAVILASPVILWQLASFISPGLYQHEKKALGVFCFFALLLALCGAGLGFFFVIPQVLTFSMTFATAELQPVIGLGNFLKLVIWMLLGFALVFELPIVLLIPVRAGLIRTAALKKFRYLFVTGIFLAAAILTPPDVISQLSLGIPGWLLFELTLFIASCVEKKAADPVEEEEEEAGGEESVSAAPLPSVGSVSERSRLASRSRRIRKL